METDSLREQQEAEFALRHQGDSDEQLLDYLRELAQQLGHPPTKVEAMGFAYIKSRLGPWPRVLEKAGLKTARPKRKVKNHNLYWRGKSK